MEGARVGDGGVARPGRLGVPDVGNSPGADRAHRGLDRAGVHCGGDDMSKLVGVLTGGGDCPGLNPAIRGVVYRGLDHGFRFVGLLEGWRGLVEGNTMPLGLPEVREIFNRGGTILGTSRTNPFKKEGAVERCLASWKELGLDALVGMGGEDTLGGATRFFTEP